MLLAGKRFTLLQTIDDKDGSVVKTLAELDSRRLIPESRAILYPARPCQGVRTALWIALGNATGLPVPFCEFRGLWLIELESRKVLLHGSQHHRTEKTIGGRVIHDVEVLNPAGDWLIELSRDLVADACEKLEGSVGDPVKATLMTAEVDLLRNVMQAFIEELDQNTIAILEAEGTGKLSVYNHYVTAISELQRNRVQAAECFPWFSRSFRNDWRLRRAIDQGKPLVSELANCYDVRPSTIKYFQELEILRVAEGARTKLVKTVDNYTAEYFPATAADHEAFMSIVDTLDDLAHTLRVDRIQLARPFINGWAVGIEKLEKSLSRKLDLELIFDMAQASFYYGVKPALQGNEAISGQFGHPPASWFQLWFSHYGLKRLLKMAYRWERLYGHFSLKRLGMSDETKVDKILNWPPLLRASYRHGPYRVVELASQHELETEGRKLEHCVASYGIKCLVSGSFIFSIRDCQGNHLSTFEIQFEDGAPIIRQHKALCNEEPEPGEQAVAKRFVERVISGVPPETVYTILGQRHRIGMLMKGVLGEPDNFEAELTEDERAQLSTLIEFTHPAAAREMGIAEYLLSAGEA